MLQNLRLNKALKTEGLCNDQKDLKEDFDLNKILLTPFLLGRE